MRWSVTFVVATEPFVNVTSTVIEKGPVGPETLYGFAVPSDAVPARSKGAEFSMWAGDPFLEPNQNLTRVIDEAGSTNR
jgi:hypothetical protein